MAQDETPVSDAYLAKALGITAAQLRGARTIVTDARGRLAQAQKTCDAATEFVRLHEIGASVHQRLGALMDALQALQHTIHAPDTSPERAAGMDYVFTATVWTLLGSHWDPHSTGNLALLADAVSTFDSVRQANKLPRSRRTFTKGIGDRLQFVLSEHGPLRTDQLAKLCGLTARQVRNGLAHKRNQGTVVFTKHEWSLADPPVATGQP